MVAVSRPILLLALVHVQASCGAYDLCNVEHTQRELDATPHSAYMEGRIDSFRVSSTCGLLSTANVVPWGSLDLLVDLDVNTMPLRLLPHSLQHDKLRTECQCIYHARHRTRGHMHSSAIDCLWGCVALEEMSV